MAHKYLDRIADTGTGYNPHVYRATDGLWLWEIRGDVLSEIIATCEAKRFYTAAEAADDCDSAIADYKDQ